MEKNTAFTLLNIFTNHATKHNRINYKSIKLNQSKKSFLMNIYKYLLPILFVLFSIQILKSQSSCSNAFSMDLDTTYNVTADNDYWVEITPDQDSVFLNIEPDKYNNMNTTVYSGNCGSLTQLDSFPGSGIHEFEGITANQTYYVKISGINNEILNISFLREETLKFFGKNTKGTNQWEFSTFKQFNLGGGCANSFSFTFDQKIYDKMTNQNYWPSVTKIRFLIDGTPNSNYTYTINDLNQLGQKPVINPTLSSGAHEILLQIYDSNTNNWSSSLNPHNAPDYQWKFVCHSYEQPVLDFDVVPDNVCLDELVQINLINPTYDQGCTYEVDVPNRPSPIQNIFSYGDFPLDYNPTKYMNQVPSSGYFTITAENGCGTITKGEQINVDLDIDFTHSGSCVNNDISFEAFDKCDHDQNYVTGINWIWDFGNGHTGSGKTISHVYDNPGDYDVTLKAITYNLSGNQVSYSFTKTITIFPKPDKPDVSGHFNDCDERTKTYTIDNYNQNNNYSISVQPAICAKSINYSGGNTFDVTWDLGQSTNPYADLVVDVVNEDNERCSNQELYRVVDCCNHDEISITNINNTSFSNLPASLQNELQDPQNHKTYMFNGDFVFDQNVTIEDKEFICGGEMKFIIADEKEVTLNDVNIYQYCNYMWDGIYIESPNSKLTLTNCDLYDAQNAVVSSNGGDFDIEATDFNNCYKGLVVKNYQNYLLPIGSQYTPHPGTIIGCSFNGSQSLSYPPYAGNYSYAGIDINEVNDITIGDVSEPQNVFKNLHCGIKAKNSYVHVKNNKFKDINLGYPQYAPSPIEPFNLLYPTAVFSASKVYKYQLNVIPRKIIVSGDQNGNNANEFDNCSYGVQSYNQAIDIRDNTFNKHERAILAYDPLSETRIMSNTIGNTKAVDYGIYLKSIQQKTRDIRVSNNDIYPVKTGIYLYNLRANLNPTNSVSVSVNSNSIYFDKLYFKNYRYGIRVENCESAKIHLNEVVRQGTTPPEGTTTFKKMYGISLASSNLCDLWSNSELKFLGAGIRVAGNCNNTSIECNEIRECQYGIVFDDQASITQMGGEDHATANKWFSNSNNYYGSGVDCRKMDKMPSGSVNFPYGFKDIPWYIEHGAVGTGNYLDPEIISGHALDWPIEVLESDQDAPATRCASGSINIPWDPFALDQLRDDYFEMMADQGLDYDSLQEQYQFYDAQFVYEVLREDPTLIDLGTVEDETFQAFYDSIQQTVTGEIEDIEDMMEQQNIDSAIIANAMMEAEEEWNVNLKYVNSIYLNKFVKNNYDFTQDEIDRLTNIALQTPQEGGDAVYIARAMLGIDPDDYESVTYGVEPEFVDKQDKETHIKVYPNPANNRIHIALKGKETKRSLFVEIYDLTGRSVQYEELGSGRDFNVNVEALKNGIYFVKVTDYKNLTEKTKIIIRH